MTSPNENPSLLGVFKYDGRFPGQRFDGSTGFLHNGFRSYAPTLGRYIQSDPLGLEAGWNTYAYVGGDPVGAVDPWGLDAYLIFRVALSVGYEYGRALQTIGPANTIMASNAALYSTQKTKDYTQTHGLGIMPDGSADAFRHCVLACTTSYFIGEDNARRLLSDHEAMNRINGGSASSSAQDIKNNEIGFACAKSGDNCADSCLQKVKNKTLTFYGDAFYD